MVRARTVRQRRARGNGCRTTARHLQVAQPQCTFECDMSSLVIFQHMHPRTVASLDTRRGGGGFLLFLILLLSGAWIIGPSSSFSVPAPLSSEIASCCERVINNNHTFALPFDSTLGFPGEQNERVERESNARLDAPTCSRAFLFCMSKRFPVWVCLCGQEKGRQVASNQPCRGRRESKRHLLPPGRASLHLLGVRVPRRHRGCPPR